MITLEKKYTYRNGEPARVLCIDAPGPPQTVVALDIRGMATYHFPDGAYTSSDTPDPRDLIEAREPREWHIRVATIGNPSYTAGTVVSEHIKGSREPEPEKGDAWEIVRVREVLPEQEGGSEV